MVHERERRSSRRRFLGALVGVACACRLAAEASPLARAADGSLARLDEPGTALRTAERLALRPPPGPDGTLMFPVSPTGPAKVYDIPGNITADGSVDVTDAINTWLRTTVPNGTATRPVIARFGRGATYRVHGSVGTSLNHPTETAGLNREYVIFDGNGCTIDWSKNTPTEFANRAGISLISALGCQVVNFTTIGPWARQYNNDGYQWNYEWQHGVAVFFSNGCTIKDCHFYNSLGDSISLSGSDNTVVENCLGDGAGRMGVALTANDNVIIRGCTFDRISYHVIDIEPETEAHPVENITITGNTIKRHRFCFIGAESGVCTPRTNYVITDNVMENSGNTSWPPIACASTIYSTTLPRGECVNNVATGLTVTGNVLRSTRNNLQVIRVRGFSDVTVTNNTCHLDAPFSDRGIATFENCTGSLLVSNNTCVGVGSAYLIDHVAHGAGVTSCGNTTLAGANQPVACA